MIARERIGVSAPYQTRDIDGIDLALSDEGNNAGERNSTEPALVCLHATGHTAADFDAIRRQVGTRMRVVTLDWPGQGRSGLDREPASAARYARLLGAVLDELEIESPVLLGNSIGGAAAIAFAAAQPERVRGLVLVDPGGLLPVNLMTRSATRAIAAFFDAGAKGRRWFGPAFAAYYRMVLQHRSASQRRGEIVSAGYDHAAVLAEAWRSFGRPDADLRPLVARIDCPVLFAWARGDQVVSYHRSRAGIRAFRDAHVERFRGGHAAFLEDADRFMNVLERYLDDLPEDEEAGGRVRPLMARAAG